MGPRVSRRCARRFAIAALALWSAAAAAEPPKAGPLTVAFASPKPAALPSVPQINSASALVVDESGRTLFAKRSREVKPIASITKLMTAMVVLDAGVALDQPIAIEESDRDTLRHSRSRLRIDRAATLPRGEMLAVALMSSDNRAASALGRTAFPGGKPAFVEAMNRKAASIGMADTHYADPTGLDGGNRSTAEDLLKLVREAAGYPLIRDVTSQVSMEVQPYGDGSALQYRNTNPLVQSPDWHVELSKTGFVNEAGHCLVMRAVVQGHRLDMVLLDSYGKRTPMGDASRLRDWVTDRERAVEARTAAVQALTSDCSRSRIKGCWE